VVAIRFVLFAIQSRGTGQITKASSRSALANGQAMGEHDGIDGAGA
jgi:hypothetical protein